ncbi:MAG TPA: FAD:protein FMN transferase [Vicinamibacterales bacterium]|nr:FAD:protein FMN transferase [Vicinamibacterales bacterium]
MGTSISRREFLTFDGRERESAPGEGHWIRVHRRIMACRFEVLLPGEHPEWVPAARTALNLADRLEARLSVFRPESELSQINRLAAAGPVRVHPALFVLLQRASALSAATDGAFDITSAPLSRCWGFLRRAGRVPPAEDVDRARQVVGMRHVELDAAAETVRFARPGVELNLGSIGKGYALDQMAAKLERLGVVQALLSAGRSSLRAIGSDRGGWPVALRPLLSGGTLARVVLRGAALATSGAGEQYVLDDGRRYGHVLDPRTGWPAQGLRSATVATRSAADADALSTAFLVGGLALAARYHQAHADTLAILSQDDADDAIVVGAWDGAMIETSSCR